MQYDLGVIGPPESRVEQIRMLYGAVEQINMRLQAAWEPRDQQMVERYRALQKKHDKLMANSHIFPQDAFKARKINDEILSMYEDVEMLLAITARQAHEMTLPLMEQIAEAESDLTISVGGSQMELIRHLLGEFKMLGPETREMGQTLPTNFPGFPEPTDFGFSDDNEFEKVVAAFEDQGITDERLDNYQIAEEEILRWSEQDAGISPHKLATSAGWIITPTELKAAVKTWEDDPDLKKLEELIKAGPPDYYLQDPQTKELTQAGAKWEITDEETAAWLGVWQRLLKLFETAGNCDGLQVT